MAVDKPYDTTHPETQAYVWDLPTRLFHWALVASVATSLISEALGNMNIHVISGHVVLALILFRIIWGFVGGRHARFVDFVKGPFKVLAYANRLRTEPPKAHLGHNPMGGWSVVAIVLIVLAQAGTGLFSNDDILIEGPLMSLVSKSTSDYLTFLHGQISNILYVLIGLHLAAVLFYTLKRQPIIKAMITGVTTVSQREAADRDAADGVKIKGSLILALVVMLITAAIAYAIKTY